MRYQIRNGSQSSHCCFEATVVDTGKPELIGGQPYSRSGVPQYEEVCECFDEESATKIADALNAIESLGEHTP